MRGPPAPARTRLVYLDPGLACLLGVEQSLRSKNETAHRLKFPKLVERLRLRRVHGWLLAAAAGLREFVYLAGVIVIVFVVPGLILFFGSNVLGLIDLAGGEQQTASQYPATVALISTARTGCRRCAPGVLIGPSHDCSMCPRTSRARPTTPHQR